ncbi:hypothetical protein POVWA1_021470 [Plasmodium ovale wallikeri]|uniref:Uncharacterized protein n=1 Tax=Plasmodium ovale wallikeri TaxID=864142 RepID=A0A1A8YRL8_PLAOA|nr:hypothetical protein POVWA1_021470 [Plasmodium ovale wallikeri]
MRACRRVHILTFADIGKYVRVYTCTRVRIDELHGHWMMYVKWELKNGLISSLYIHTIGVNDGCAEEKICPFKR